MTGQQLKNSILQEAIHGHLVPNILQPDEKTGAELLQMILSERQKKENEEKGKKAKNLTLSAVEDEPWELPEGWCWCKLGDLSDRLVGKTPERANAAYWSPGILPWVSISDMQDYGKVETTKESVSALAEKNVFSNRISKKGSLIMSFKLTVGRTCILGIDAYHNEAIVTFLLPEWLDTLKMYLFWLLPVFTNSSDSKDAVKGKTLNKDSINATDIPLPPLSIQKAIVNKIEELFPFVDEYDKAAVELETLNKTLPEKIRKSVLQEAIHGTLVPNDISDGEATATELLQQILNERQEKENKEKGKKAKKLTLSIIEEEPWELPDGWCWCRGKDIFFPMESIKPTSDFVYIDTDAVNNKKNIIDRPKNVLLKDAPSRATRKLHTNDILFSMVRPYLKNIAYVDERFSTAIGTTGFYVITTSPSLYQPYLFKMMLSDYVVSGLTEFMKGDNSPSINNGHIEDFLYPIPPLSVQHRIVEKIEEVFSAIEKLQS